MIKQGKEATMSHSEKPLKPVDRSRLMLLGALSAASLGSACVVSGDSRWRDDSPAAPSRDTAGGDGGGGGGGGGHSH